MQNLANIRERYRFGFNGMPVLSGVEGEKDPEITGQEGSHYTAAFWEYDTRIARRWNVDPVDKPWESSYLTFSGNPIVMVDPMGDNANPIYDKEGEFLGTDDKGLQGDAIVMDKDDFKQGMAHDDAKEKGTFFSEMEDIGSPRFFKIKNHHDYLSTRPDWDGYVTINEGIEWAMSHPNLSANGYANASPDDKLYLDINKLDFGNLSRESLAENGIVNNGDERNVNLLNYTEYYNITKVFDIPVGVDINKNSIRTTYALGNTTIRLINEETVEIMIPKTDYYDWDYHDYPRSRQRLGLPPKSRRDKLIHLERKRKGLNDSHGFPIEVYGTTNL